MLHTLYYILYAIYYIGTLGPIKVLSGCPASVAAWKIREASQAGDLPVATRPTRLSAKCCRLHDTVGDMCKYIYIYTYTYICINKDCIYIYTYIYVHICNILKEILGDFVYQNLSKYDVPDHAIGCVPPCLRDGNGLCYKS